jgi:hypothetical protein
VLNIFALSTSQRARAEENDLRQTLLLHGSYPAAVGAR